MPTTDSGNIVPMTRMEALASELRLLQSTMTDMQGRLEALLADISTELRTAPAAEVPSSVAIPEAEGEIEIVSQPLAVEPEAPGDAFVATTAEPAHLVAEGEPVSTDALALAETPLETPTAAVESPVVDIEASQAAIETSVASEAQAVEPGVVSAEVETEMMPVATEAAETVEATQAAQAAEILAEPVVEAAAATDIVEPASDVAAEPAVLAPSQLGAAAVAAEPVDAEVAVVLPKNAIVLAERRSAPRKSRTVVVRAGRWAARTSRPASVLSCIDRARGRCARSLTHSAETIL